MKKLLISCLLVATSAIHSQVKSNSNDVSFGLKGGINIANFAVSGDGAPSTNSLVGFNFGAFAEIKINEKFSFQPEVLYSSQGSKFELTLPIEDQFFLTKNTFKFSYLNIPMMFKYYPDSKFFLEAGPQIGFLTAAKLEVNVDGFGSAEESVKDSFKAIDFGFGLGLGYNITNQFGANLRYNLGLSNIAETEPDDNSSIKNNVFAVSLFYRFK